MGYAIKKGGSSRPLLFLMIDSADHVSGKTGLTPTVRLSKNGGAFSGSAPSGDVTEIANGWYQVAGNATDSDTAGPLVLHATATGADPCDEVFDVQTNDPDGTLADLDTIAEDVVAMAADVTLIKQAAVGKRTYEIATGVDKVYDAAGTSVLKTLTPTEAAGTITRTPS
jgi:hypothetical protein